MEEERLKIGLKVSINTIIGNIILSILKVICGVISSSSAIIADGIHSLSDVFTTIGVIVGLKLSSKNADRGHPYGHERIESITSLFLSIVLFIVAIWIGYCGVENILTKNYTIPGKSAIAAAIISIVSKEAMYFYTIKYAKKIKSTSLKADAWHHRSDSLSSIGVLIGLIGARNGYPILDPLAAIIICLIIIKVSYDICRQSIDQLIDASADDEKVNIIIEKIIDIDGVKRIDNLKTRQYASKVYVDVEISVDSELSVEEGHNIAMKVHNYIEEDRDIKHCMVHVNPYLNKK
ncbi:cation diffusion facilitator family transporter [uncultured Clostridium sp.]|uniref:cation diffusion facilitator family transporter n=1 Tax=uncultured Clostridium sp. TaxID=59620 RepID=UPI0025D22699|nr:cation diffusion facilitator family transporter [uncultured Clostridium sp.]